MVQLIQSSFSKGEIAPAFYGRVDTSMYKSALRTARNTIAHVSGGVSSRPGSRFIAPVADHTYAPRLIEFQFKTTDKYILEFGNLYMRVIRDDGHVLETAVNITAATQANPIVVSAAAHGYSDGDEVYITGVLGMTELNGRRFIVANKTAGTFELTSQVDGTNIDGTGYTAYSSVGTVAKVYEIVTPYATADLFNITFTQSADIMTLAHKTYGIRELSRLDHDDWTISEPTFGPTIAVPQDVTVVAGTTGAEVERYRVTTISETNGEESLPGYDANFMTAVTAATQANPVVVTAVSHGRTTADKVFIHDILGMTEINDRYFTITVLTGDTFELDSEDGTGHTAYTSGGWAEASISGATAANPVVMTHNAHGFLDGDEVYISGVVGMTELNDRRFLIQNGTTDTYELVDEDGTAHTAYTSGGRARPTLTRITNGAVTADNVVSWDVVSGAERYAIYKFNSGVYGLIGETEGTTFTDANINPDGTISHPRARNPFIGTDNFPGAVSYFEQRRVFGGTNNNPDTSYYSQTGGTSNFNISLPLQADDAITATLNSRQVNEIRHFVPLNDLITFTSGSEWRINSGDNSGFAVDTLKQKPQSYWGSSYRAPIVIGNVIMYIDATDAVVRSTGWSFQADGYVGVDMSFLASHLISGKTISDWAYQRSPESRVHMVRNDGKMLTMVFEQDQEVIAWTHWDTDGKFEAVAALQGGGTYNEDSVYAVVKRTINGNTVRYIEVFRQTFFDVIQDAFFVDSGLTLDDPITITGATAANPVVITATGHGLSDGDEVDLSDIVWVKNIDATFSETQPTQLNGGRYTVANKTANTFELSGVDGSAFNAYVEGGIARLAVTSVGGLHHLEGESISLLSDGNVVTGLTVTDGVVTLPRKASRVHAGINFITDVGLLDIEVEGGTVQGRMKKIPEVTVRFEKSRGMFIGHDTTDLVEMKQREYEALGAPTSLLTGDKKVTLKPAWNSNGRLFIRNPYPLPMTILAVIPTVKLGDTSV